MKEESTQTHICRAINMSNALKQKSNNLNETKPNHPILFIWQKNTLMCVCVLCVCIIIQYGRDIYRRLNATLSLVYK